MKTSILIPSAVAICLILSLTLSAGPLTPPTGSIAPTGRFGPRVDILTLPGDSSSTRVVSQPGSYYLSGNLSATPGTRAIRVLAANVTIDLNGFSIDGNGGHGIQTGPGAGGYLVIKNGDVVDGDNGIFIALVDMLTLENVTVRDCAGSGVFANVASRGGIVRGCYAFGNGVAGMAFTGSTFVVTDCVARDNGGDGLSSSGSSLFSNCISFGNAGSFDIRTTDGLIRGCVATNIQLAAGSTGVENHSP